MQPKRRFAFHVPGPSAKRAIDKMRVEFSRLGGYLDQLPDCREKSLAVTNLEQAAMWANRAAVVSDPESKEEVQ